MTDTVYGQFGDTPIASEKISTFMEKVKKLDWTDNKFYKAATCVNISTKFDSSKGDKDQQDQMIKMYQNMNFINNVFNEDNQINNSLERFSEFSTSFVSEENERAKRRDTNPKLLDLLSDTSKLNIKGEMTSQIRSNLMKILQTAVSDLETQEVGKKQWILQGINDQVKNLEEAPVSNVSYSPKQTSSPAVNKVAEFRKLINNYELAESICQNYISKHQVIEMAVSNFFMDAYKSETLRLELHFPTGRQITVNFSLMSPADSILTEVYKYHQTFNQVRLFIENRQELVIDSNLHFIGGLKVRQGTKIFVK